MSQSWVICDDQRLLSNPPTGIRFGTRPFYYDNPDSNVRVNLSILKKKTTYFHLKQNNKVFYYFLWNTKRILLGIITKLDNIEIKWPEKEYLGHVHQWKLLLRVLVFSERMVLDQEGLIRLLCFSKNVKNLVSASLEVKKFYSNFFLLIFRRKYFAMQNIL